LQSFNGHRAIFDDRRKMRSLFGVSPFDRNPGREFGAAREDRMLEGVNVWLGGVNYFRPSG
jgi:hypothetical protein